MFMIREIFCLILLSSSYCLAIDQDLLESKATNKLHSPSTSDNSNASNKNNELTDIINNKKITLNEKVYDVYIGVNLSANITTNQNIKSLFIKCIEKIQAMTEIEDYVYGFHFQLFKNKVYVSSLTTIGKNGP